MADRLTREQASDVKTLAATAKGTFVLGNYTVEECRRIWNAVNDDVSLWLEHVEQGRVEHAATLERLDHAGDRLAGE
jgi:hypothetical protein